MIQSKIYWNIFKAQFWLQLFFSQLLLDNFCCSIFNFQFWCTNFCCINWGIGQFGRRVHRFKVKRKTWFTLWEKHVQKLSINQSLKIEIRCYESYENSVHYQHDLHRRNNDWADLQKSTFSGDLYHCFCFMFSSYI